MNRINHCPVCGYRLNEPSWLDDRSASFEICPSCGIQFGYDDVAGGDMEKRSEVYRSWRAEWVQRGMPWESIGMATPDSWNPQEQLKNILEP